MEGQREEDGKRTIEERERGIEDGKMREGGMKGGGRNRIWRRMRGGREGEKREEERRKSDHTQQDRTQFEHSGGSNTKTNDSPGFGLLCGDVQLEILHVHGTVRKLGKAEVRAPCQGLPTPRQLEERRYQVKPRHVSEKNRH